MVLVEDRWLKTAYAYLFIRDFARALDVFRQAMVADPTNASYYFYASITAERNGLRNEAYDFANAASELEPSNALYLQRTAAMRSKRLVDDGLRLLESGDMTGAYAKFQQALESDPLNLDAEHFCSRLGADHPLGTNLTHPRKFDDYYCDETQ